MVDEHKESEPQDADHEVPADLMELFEVLEWEQAVAEVED